MTHHDDEPLNVPTIRYTAAHPRRAFAISCASFCLVFLLAMVAAFGGGLILFSTEVPFYNRAETNRKRNDGITAGENSADGLQSAGTQELERARADVEMYVLYLLDAGENIIAKDYIDRIASIEREMRYVEDYAPLAYWMEGFEAGVTPPQNATDSGYCTLDIPSAFPQETYDPYNPQFGSGEVRTDSSALPSGRMCLRHSSLVNFNDLGYFDYWNNTGLGWYLENTESAPLYNIGDEAHIELFRTFWSTFTRQEFDIGPFVFPDEEVEFVVGVGNIMYEVTSSDFGGLTNSTTARGARSVFKFGVPRFDEDDGDLYDSNDIDENAIQEMEIGAFMYDNFHSFLDGKKGGGGIDIYWNDNLGLMSVFEINKLLFESMLWLAGSITFVWSYLILSTNSVLIATMGMGQIFMCFGPAILLYRGLFGFRYFGTLQMLAIFIIMGIGVDDMFVVLDSWAQRAEEKDILLRLSSTMRHASKAMFTTSATTFVSFVANMTSAFPAIKTFGAFSAMLVLVNFCAVCTFFPTVVVMWQVYHADRNILLSFVRRLRGVDEPTKFDRSASRSLSGVELVNQGGDETSEPLDTTTPAPSKPPSGELRMVERFFHDKWSLWLVSYRRWIFLSFTILLAFFLWGTASLEPDPDTPQLLPSDNNYQKYGDKLRENYNRAENPEQIVVNLQHGIRRDSPIDRSGTDETLADDIGEANYCTDPYIFHDLGATSQMAFVDLCLSAWGDDLIYGEIPGGTQYPAKDREVYGRTDTTNYFGLTLTDVMTCPWVGFREWCLDPYRSLNHTHDLCDPAQAGTGLAGDCVIDYPILDSSGYDISALFAAWYQDPQRDAVTGKTNAELYVEYIFLDDCSDPDEWDDLCDVGIVDEYDVGSVRFVMSDIRLDAVFAQAFRDGIDLHDKWEGWWVEFTDEWQTKAEYSTPEYAEDGTALNSAGRYSYPPKLVDCGYQAAPAWAYYFLNQTLIRETFLGILLALFLAWVILTLACGNWIISSLSVGTIILIVFGVMAFTVAAGWKLGVLEAINFVMVIGLSIDYCVHLSEAFTVSTGATRAEKVQDMLTVMGVSVVSGAISSIGASIWMLGAGVTFFPKFASFILVTIALSLLFSMTFFPAMLSVCGPLGSQGRIDWLYDAVYRMYVRVRDYVAPGRAGGEYSAKASSSNADGAIEP
eukprot:Rmarinus@m.23908